MARAETVKPDLTVLPRPLHDVGGEQLLIGMRSALAWLQVNQEHVNDLNVFPVPDGDTGSNMYMTLRSAVAEAQKVGDPASAGAVMAAVAHGSLMGARGNSGVILSQIFRGFAAGLAGRARIDAHAFADGIVEAASVAYKAVMKPTEGTVLTVIREASQAARAAARETDDLRVVLDRTVAEAHAAVGRTTSQLAVLREAGVVDAGGYGLAVILEGIARSLVDGGVGLPSAAAVPDAEAAPSSTRRGAAAVAAKEDGWGYCTEFLIHGPGLKTEVVRDELAAMGESVLIVGDDDLVRVHIHTGDPGLLITAAAVHGRLSKLKVEDMTAQHHDVLERADASDKRVARIPLAVVSVAPGDGFRDILSGLGAAAVVEGGQTMNPSIADMLTAVRAANADSVILLPNNSNVILTAQQVDALAEDVIVVVVPTRNLPQGVSAMLALDPTATADENAGRMASAIKSVSCVEVTRAVRDSTANGLDIKSGDVIAILDDEITEVGSDYGDVTQAVLGKVATPPELVTVYRGAEVSETDAAAMVATLGDRFPAVEFQLHAGGQDHYPYVLSLE